MKLFKKSSEIKFSFHLQSQGHLLDFIKSSEGGAGKCGTVPSYTYILSFLSIQHTTFRNYTVCAMLCKRVQQERNRHEIRQMSGMVK